MLNISNYVKVASLEEAYELNQKKTNIIIGGMLWLKMQNRNIGTAIDLSDLGLDKIAESQDEFIIGSMVTLRQLEENKEFNEYTNNAAKECVESIVGVQFRNMATIGGSIYGRFGFSDVLTMFLGLETYVELYKGGRIPLRDYAQLPYDRDIIIGLVVKKTPVKCAYMAMRNAKTDFPILTCMVTENEGAFTTVIGARPGRAEVIKGAKDCLEGIMTDESKRTEQLEEYKKYISGNVVTHSNVRGSEKYRRHLAGVLAGRCVEEIIKGGCKC